MGVNRERGESLIRNVLLVCVLRERILRTVGEKIGEFWKKRKNTSFLKLASLVVFV